MPKLSIELVPSTAWGSNLREWLQPKAWKSLRARVLNRAGHSCEICGLSGANSPLPPIQLHCHETWEWDLPTRKQKLVGLQCLCVNCHSVKHFGLATLMGKMGHAMTHLMFVNKWSRAEAQAHIDAENALWKERSKVDWTIDLSLLKEFLDEH